MNLALLHLGAGLQITSLTTEQTSVAKSARMIYNIKRDELQAARPWNFNKFTAQLVLVTTAPNPVWAFAYQYPSDCLFARRILGTMTSVVGTPQFQLPANAITNVGNMYAPQVDTASTAVKFEVAEGQIFTNQANAILVYSQRNTNEDSWPQRFVWAMSYAIASVLAPSLTNGDPFGLGPKMAAMAEKTLKEAAREQANERLQIQPPSEFEEVR